MGARAERCKIEGCEFPIYWTKERLCIEHVLHPAKVEEPPPVDPPRPASARAAVARTPKEKP